MGEALTSEISEIEHSRKLGKRKASGKWEAQYTRGRRKEGREKKWETRERKKRAHTRVSQIKVGPALHKNPGKLVCPPLDSKVEGRVPTNVHCVEGGREGMGGEEGEDSLGEGLVGESREEVENVASAVGAVPLFLGRELDLALS
jgi:hypothetical protein